MHLRCEGMRTMRSTICCLRHNVSDGYVTSETFGCSASSPYLDSQPIDASTKHHILSLYCWFFLYTAQAAIA
jgi:hypothetical protein